MDKQEFEKKLVKFISEYQGIDIEEIKVESNLIMDLALTSMELFEVFNQISEWMDIDIEASYNENFEVLQDIIDFVYRLKEKNNV